MKEILGLLKPERADSKLSEQEVRSLIKEIKEKATLKSQFKAVMWLIAGLAIILIFGFWVAILAYISIFMRLYGNESWKLIIAIAGVAWIACYLFFHIGLKHELYGGLLGLSFL